MPSPAMAGAAAGDTALGAPGIALPRPRLPRPVLPGWRLRRRRRRTRVRPSAPAVPFPARALAHLRALPDHRWLDRAVRGRTWIFLLGFLLAGIVAMQVEVLKLGASIGRSIEQGQALQSRNELLRARVAELSDDHRIEQIAGTMGMVTPAPAAVGFLAVRHGDVQKAAQAIQPPNPTSFLSQLAASNAAATADSQGTPGTSTASSASTGSATTYGSTTTSASGTAATTSQATTSQATTTQTTTPQTTTAPTSGALATG